MATDKQATGLTILRVFIGTFFIFEGIGKIRWLTNPSLLAAQLTSWSQAVPSGSLSHAYLERLAIPYVRIFARLVPIGEIVSGIAMVTGFWTPLFAFVAFLMALNFLFASSALFKYSFLTNGYGLPVLGSTLALTLAGGRKGKSQRRSASP
jgi:uncharacterized membrane protein YphA (DoxX/SURF4 family)